jgi:hypothetical protein
MPLELARSCEWAARGHGLHARRARETRSQTGPDAAEDSGNALG